MMGLVKRCVVTFLISTVMGFGDAGADSANYPEPINDVSVAVSYDASNVTISANANNVAVNSGQHVYTVFASIESASSPGSTYWFGLQETSSGSADSNSGSNWSGKADWPFSSYAGASVKVWACNQVVSSASCPADNMVLLAHKTLGVDPGVSVLMYHLISDPPANNPSASLYVSPANFEQQMSYLANSNFVSLFASEIESYPSNKRSVVVTLDDGYEDNYTNAYPVLKNLHLKGTIFIVPALVNTPGYLTTAQIQEMLSSGFISIQNHTYSHLDDRAGSFSPSEITSAKTWIESLSGAPVVAIAYPYGFFNDDVINVASSSGHKYGFTVNPGRFHLYDGTRKSDYFRIPRQAVWSGLSLSDFAGLLW